MRILIVLFILASSLVAGEPALTARFPDGALAYLQARGLAGKIDAVLASPLGKEVLDHPAVKAFLQGPEGRKLLFGQAMLQGATGMDLKGILHAVAGQEIALAVYGKNRVVVIARVDAEKAETLITGAEILSQSQRTVVLEADGTTPALWRIGPAFLLAGDGLLVASTDQALAAAVRDRTAQGLHRHAHLPAARRFVGTDADLFGYVDLNVFGAKLRQGEKPKNLGEALMLGAFAHTLPAAPWGAFGVSLVPDGDAWRISAKGYVPQPAEPKEAVYSAYGGTLADLPFALPERTVGVMRFRRDLLSVWSYREALIAERGIPGLIEFETNFGNLTGGISWVEELLPKLGNEFTVVATRRVYDGGAAPAVRLPQGALLIRVEDARKLDLKFQVAFNNMIGIVNITSQQMKGDPLLNMAKEYKGVTYQTARYLPPSEGEMEEQAELPIRYNFTPSLGVVGDHLVIASTEGALKEIIDAHGRATPAPAGVNAGLWLRPAEIRTILRENRESLVAQTILKEGVTRAEAEQRIDVLLELAGLVRSFSLTAEESASTLGLRFETVMGPARG